ncbi:XRE family transcriptional regulator [Candidatus Magnetobacterium casense]|uniref:XRE family transcriptional regulator n=1 Tax=Candidatus Magnetobacterium casense TaxID=1455061 RepID=UPI00058BAB31|nr:XRE family transcriptional regulator [Candidatus Magnetobacterium casensis]
MEYKEIVDYLLRSKGWKPIDLANKLNKDPNIISQWRTGYRNVGKKALKEISQAFGITMDAIERAHETGDVNCLVPSSENIPDIIRKNKNVTIERDIVMIPVYDGVKCGVNGITRGELISMFSVPVSGVRGIPNPEQNCFWVVAEGDSMLPRIYPGDLVLAVKSGVVEIRNGDYVLFFMDDETTLKIFNDAGDNIVLTALNISYKPIVIKKKEIAMNGVNMCKVLKILSNL